MTNSLTALEWKKKKKITLFDFRKNKTVIGSSAAPADNTAVKIYPPFLQLYPSEYTQLRAEQISICSLMVKANNYSTANIHLSRVGSCSQ